MTYWLINDDCDVVRVEDGVGSDGNTYQINSSGYAERRDEETFAIDVFPVHSTDPNPIA